MPRLTTLSIRSLLFLIICIVALPAAGIIVFSGIKFRDQMINETRKETLKLADGIATEQQNLVIGAEQLMTALAQLPEVKNHDTAKVEPILRELRKLNPFYSNIFIADQKGTVWATAVPVKPPFIIADRRYFKNALNSGKLSSGEFVLSRATAKPAFNLAYPMKDARGNVVGVISVGFVIEQYKKLLEQTHLPPGSSFVIIDHQGLILYRAINPEKYIGKAYMADEFLKMKDGPDSGSSFRLGYTGDKRIISYRKLRLPGEQTPYMYVTAGVPTDMAALEANRSLKHSLILLTFFLTLACASAVIIGKRSIVDRFKLIEDASHRLASGDLQVRVSDVVTGGELGSLGQTFDVMATELARREEERLIAETDRDRLIAILEATTDVASMATPDGTVMYINRAGRELTGIGDKAPSEILNSHVHPEWAAKLVLNIGIPTAISMGVWKGDSALLDSNGREIPVSQVIVSHYDAQGNLSHISTIMRDISELKETNRTLELYRYALDNARDAIFLTKSDACFLFANQAACEVLGYSSQELIDMHVFDIDPSFPQAVWEAHWNDMMKQGTLRIETEHRTKAGELIPVEMALNLFVFENEEYLLAASRDLTERRRNEEERFHLEQQLLHAQKLESLGVLAGGIAHDFNNILMAIIGNADLALMRINKESPATENLHRIEQAAARAADLAKQMLAYSGKGKFVVENIDLNHLLEDMLHMLEVSISKKAILRLNLHQNLPGIEADATQIRQIIMNLVINASEAIGDKSGVIAITTGCMDCDKSYLKNVWLDENIKEGLYIYLEIADTGCGMDKATLAKLFDPFFTTKFTGRGLGMAAVLGIVRGHRGAIKVYSEPNKGTTFKVLMPASNRPMEIFNSDTLKDGWTGSGTVLLVDDEESVRGIGKEMLQELGFKAITANDGRDAVEIFKSTPGISIVILDLTMPHMDGEQCFRELRQIRPDVKVIMSSGFNEQDVTQKFVGKGLAGFIQKPYKLSTLKEAIKGI